MKRFALAIVLSLAPAVAFALYPYPAVHTGLVSPSQFANLALWIKPQLASSISFAASTTSICQVNDQSGNANNLTKDTCGTQTTAQPVIATAAQNGKDCIQFTSATSQQFNLTSNLNLASGYTVISVVRRLGSSVVEILGVGSNGVGPEWFSDRSVYAYDGTNYKATAAQTTDTTGYHFMAATLSGGTLAIYFDSPTAQSLPGSGAQASTLTAISKFGFGDSSNTNGYICETVAYTRGLSAAEIAQLYYGYYKPNWAMP